MRSLYLKRFTENTFQRNMRNSVGQATRFFFFFFFFWTGSKIPYIYYKNTRKSLLPSCPSGSTKNGDEELKKIAEEIFSNGGCVAPHTLNV